MLSEIVLPVPHVKSDCIQRVSVDGDASFEEVLALIHETIPCHEVPCKPNLSYKLSNAPAKSPSICLADVDDWAGCLDSLADADAMKKKCAGQSTSSTIPINIIIPDIVSRFTSSTVPAK